MPKTVEITVLDFIKLADTIMAREKINKSILAKELGISNGHFSKLYTRARPVPSHILEALKQLEAGKLKLGSASREGPEMSEIANMIGRMEGRIMEKLDRMEKRLDEVEEKKTKEHRI